MPIAIDPNTLYSREDLDTMLSPLGLSARTFISRLPLRDRPFRKLYLGADILMAFREFQRVKPARTFAEAEKRMNKGASIRDLVFGGTK